MIKGYDADLHYGDLMKDKYMRIRFKKNYDLVKSKLLSGKKVKVLDIGGYTGDTYEFIRRHDEIDINKIDYYILDYDINGMKIAKKRGARIKQIDLNFEQIRKVVKNEKFDIIICTEVLEHLLDPQKHIQDINFLLKNDGVALISLPNENMIFHRIYSLLGLGIDQCVFELYKHLHFPTIIQAFNFVNSSLDVEKRVFFINPSGKGSRFGFLGIFLQMIPDFVWQWLANKLPGLFARGTIFLCGKKET